MSSATRRFRIVSGKVREVFAPKRAADVMVVGRSLLPNSHNSIEGHSIAMSIPDPTPERIAEANEFCRRRGISGVEFDARHKHNCRITSNRGFAKYLKAKGRYNVDAGCHGY